MIALPVFEDYLSSRYKLSNLGQKLRFTLPEVYTTMAFYYVKNAFQVKFFQNLKFDSILDGLKFVLRGQKLRFTLVKWSQIEVYLINS